MLNRILKNKIEAPSVGDWAWYFPVEVRTGRAEPRIVRVRVETYDLHIWIKEAIGHYPKESVGNKRQLKDMLHNWDAIELVLQKKFASLF